MTAHELANKLLQGPDDEVCFWKYMGGDDELVEVKDVSQDEQTGKIVLKTYIET